MCSDNSRFKIIEEPIKDLKKIARIPISDDRGHLERLFCLDELKDLFSDPIKQVNFTETKVAGTVRGLHYQLPPAGETKLVSVLQGAIYDIVLDLRAASSTFGQVFTFRLNAEHNHSLLIPAGFAHGFQTLSDSVKLIYFHDNSYNKSLERGVKILDKKLNIEFPISSHSLSKRDTSFPVFDDAEVYNIEM